MHVMVVDDEVDMFDLYMSFFRSEIKEGTLKFSFCENAQSCLDYLDKNGIENLDIVLTDINMPGMSGLEMLEIVAKKYPKLEVFLVSAYDSSVYRKKGAALGASLFISKPMDFKDLREEFCRRL